MAIISRYKRLNIWNKLGVWGALASLVGLTLWFFQEPQPTGQTTSVYASRRSAIYQAGRDIIVQIESSTEAARPIAESQPASGTHVSDRTNHSPRASASGLTPPALPEKPADQPPHPNVSIRGPVQGPIIISQGQTGGQVANTINNFGPPNRTIPTDARDRMLAVLRSTHPPCIAFASTQGNFEAHEFKSLLMSVFLEAGWDVKDRHTFMFFGAKKGLVITIPVGAPQSAMVQVVHQALAQTGNPLMANRGDMANECGLFIQVWDAP